MNCHKPKAHLVVQCCYCGCESIHSQSFEPEAHTCEFCQRTFVIVPSVEIRRVEGEAQSWADEAKKASRYYGAAA